MIKTASSRTWAILAILALLWMAGPLCAQITLVSTGSVWKYNNLNQDLGTSWRLPGYDDSLWGGPVPGPIGDNFEAGIQLCASVIDIGPIGARFPVVYYRKTFNVSGAAVYSGLILRLNRDDAAVVYLNGALLKNDGVPEPVSFAYSGGPPTSGNDEITYFSYTLPASALVEGQNVLAVENHQQVAASSDLQFDLGLEGAVDTTPPTIASIYPPANSTVISLPFVNVIFSEAVTGVDASDLRIGAEAATSVVTNNPNDYTFYCPSLGTGVIHVAWASTNGIRDLSPLSNPFAGGTWNYYTIDPNATESSVIISEFMASNNNTLRDEDGDSSDWIEIYNSGNAAVDLDGYFLTDRTNELSRWRIPSVILPGGGPQDTNSYLVIFASGKNRTNDFTRLHTNFKLGAGGGYLALLDPFTNVVSEFSPAYPTQQTDVSYGRDATDPTVLGYFPTPTPGSRNSMDGPGFAPAVEFSRTSCAFATNTPFALTLNTPVPEATIYYTISASQITANVLPSTNALLYQGPITISNTVMIRARAFAPGLFPGPIQTQTFIALSTETNVLNFVSDLPIMILHNFGGGDIPVLSNQFVWVQTYEPEYGTNSLLGQPSLAERGIFHLHGNSSLNDLKKSLFLEVQDEAGADKDVPLLGLPAESDWVLHAQTPFEPGLLQNPVAFQITRDMGQYASRTRFVEVFLKDDLNAGPINADDYNGIYLLTEKIKIAHNRLDIERVRVGDTALPQLSGGYLFSFDYPPDGEGYFLAGGTEMVCVEPHYAELSSKTWLAQSNYIAQYFDSFSQALVSTNWTDTKTGYRSWIDVDSWIDRHLHEILTMRIDAFGHSSYFYKPRNGLIRLGPPWDYDRSQGSTFITGTTNALDPREWLEPYEPYNPTPRWPRLFQDPDFSQQWVDRYQQFRHGPLSLTNIVTHISEFAAQVRHAYPRDQARWVIPGYYPYAPNPPRRADGTGVGTYDTEVQWMKNWYSNRLDFLDLQFVAPPALSSSGGSVSPGFEVVITPPSEPGTAVIYTLDGTDPRLPGGAIAPGASSNLGPTTVHISSNARIVARSFNSTHMNLAPNLKTPWSSLVAGTFITATPPLRITEIMYHPAPSVQAPAVDPENFEYIEVENISDQSLNTAGYRLGGGIDFLFGDLILPAGAAAVVVKDLDAFQSRYGTNNPNILIAGVFSGNLNNGGDHLTLTGPLLEPILDFSYDNSWYPTTDGLGFSLVLRDASVSVDAWSQPQGWRPSAFPGGSPGQVDATPLLELPVFINEVLANPDTNALPPQLDAVELFNPGDAPVDLSGWFLSDDFATPQKYIIPQGTWIAPRGYLTFSAAEFGNSNSPAVFIPFGFSSTGDDAWLFSGDGRELTGYAHGFHFGASAKGISFGRYLTSSGKEQFVAQSALTLGAENAGPRIGPIVISEINYHPLDTVTNGIASNNTQDEFIELFNNSDSTVALYDGDHPANTWRLRGGVSYDFPAGITLSPHSFLLLVSFDPRTNAAATATFLARNYATSSIPIYGPWTGHLDNQGDDVELQRPGGPGVQEVPYILVEEVSFSDVAPWAEGADGFGPTLQRISSNAYGNDASNWNAAAPTPGAGFSPGIPPSITGQPGDQFPGTGRPVTFSVTATGDPPLRYVWRHQGAPIPGATNSLLTISNVQPGDEGMYNVVVYNAGGTAFTTNFTVNTHFGLRFIAKPANRFAQAGQTTNFTVIAEGSGTVHYQWRFNGISSFPPNVGGNDTDTLTITSADNSNEGIYTCAVSDDYDTIVNDPPATFTIIARPFFILHPLSQSSVQGESVTFSAAVSGTKPLTYRWRKGTTTFTSGILHTNQDMTYSTLTLTNLQASDAASYNVVVSNLLGFAQGGPSLGVSTQAILTVLSDFDHDGLPDFWEADRVGFSTNNAADGARDDDHDGMSNAAEYIAGTDYLNSASYLRLDIQGGGFITLTLNAVSNRTYTLLYSPTLIQPSWSKLADVLARPTNRIEILTDTNRATERYYRLVTPIQP